MCHSYIHSCIFIETLALLPISIHDILICSLNKPFIAQCIYVKTHGLQHGLFLSRTISVPHNLKISSFFLIMQAACVIYSRDTKLSLNLCKPNFRLFWPKRWHLNGDSVYTNVAIVISGSRGS